MKNSTANESNVLINNGTKHDTPKNNIVLKSRDQTKEKSSLKQGKNKTMKVYLCI